MSAEPGSSDLVAIAQLEAPAAETAAAAADDDAAAACAILTDNSDPVPCWGGQLRGTLCQHSPRLGLARGQYYCEQCWKAPSIPAERVRLASDDEKGWTHPSSLKTKPWHWARPGGLAPNAQVPQQLRCGKVYGQQGERAPKKEDGVDAAFVSPRDVSAAESQQIQSLYPHWFEERDGRKCLKLIVEKRKPRGGNPTGEPIHLLPLPPEPADPAASVAFVAATRRVRPRLHEPVPAGGITANGSSSASAAAASSSTSAGHSLAADAAEPPIALSVVNTLLALQQPGESDADYQQRKSQLIGELSQVINMLATGRQPEGLQLLTLRTASAAYPRDEPNAALCRLVGSLLERLSLAGADSAAADAPVTAPAAAPAPLGGQVDVLLVVCTPAGLQALPQAPLEASAIGELLRASDRRHHCTTLAEGDGGGAAALNALMMRCEPRVVCFIGHGDAWLPFAGDTTLGLANASGALELISPSTLATVLGEASRRVELVVLNGCSTEKLCEAVSTGFGVPAIGWSTVAADVAAKLFSIAIFGYLAPRLDKTLCDVVRDAFAHGERAIKVASRLVRGANGESVQAWALADPMQPRERNAGEPIPAGLPVLLAPLPAEKLHNVPRLPSHHVERPEQLNLRDKLLSGRSGGGSMLGIVGKGFATRDASAVAVGIAGSAGLGKSTAAAWLAHEVRVQTAFCDGIFWLTFGQEREALALLNELAEVAGVADGKLDRAGRDAARVVQLIKERLAKKNCLIILDDVWRTQQPEPFRRLSEGTTTILLTTRKRNVTDYFGATLLPLEQMPDEVALELLTEVSGKSADELRGRTRVSQNELSRLLKLCSGIPAMLRSVGRMCSRMTVPAVLDFFANHRLEHEVPEEMDAAEGYGNLFLAIEGQLNMLREEKPALEQCCLMTAVFREDDQVPVSFLPTLWNVSPARASGIVTRLAKEHLIQLSEDGETMSLLDVHRDYYACRAKSELAGWHSGLLRRSGVREICHDSSSGSEYWFWDEGGARFLHHVRNGEHPDNLLVDVPSLHTLRLIDDSEIGDDGAQVLASSLADNKTGLTTLDLSANKIGPAGGAAIGKALAANEVMTTLYISENDIGDEGAKALASALRVNEVLKDLNLLRSQIGAEGAAALGKALEVNAVLTSLGVSFNELTEEAALGIVRVERQRNKLTSLGLGGCDIGPKGAAEIAEYVSGSAVLTDLNLCHNQIRDEGAAAIAEALRGDAVLTKLLLGGNKIGPEGGVAIGKALAANAVLAIIDLEENSIGDEGATAIGGALTVNAVLTSLNVGGNYPNYIGPTGATAIAEALRGNGVLKTLDIGYSNIGPKGAAAIAEALRGNAVLTDLNLCHNNIRDEGAAAIAEALRGNAVLTDLNLFNNNIRDEGAAAIAEALRGNEVLKNIDLSDNNLGDEGEKAIHDAVSGREGLELEM